jgi:hypothetical protein
VNIQNLIRGAVAIAVGYAVGELAHLGFHLSAAAEASVIGAIAAVVGTFYLHIVADLEKRWPWIGWLLGVKAKPAPAKKP